MGGEKEEKHVPAQKRFIWDDRQLTGLSLTYRCCSRDVETAGEIAVHHPEYNQPEYMAGELMDVSTGRAIWRTGEVDGSITMRWDYVRLLSLTSTM